MPPSALDEPEYQPAGAQPLREAPRQPSRDLGNNVNRTPIIRQGDVLLHPVASLPDNCAQIGLDKGRIVLAYGEVTGHAHAIADHGLRKTDHEAAHEIAEAAIARAKARLWRSPDGARFLEVVEPVTLTHEEHTAHTIQPGIYQLPTQVEYVAPELVRQVAD